MTASEVAEKVIRALQDSGIPFVVVGSFSSNQYGIPRSTNDIDLVVQCASGGLEQLGRILGPDFAPESQLRFETNTGTVCQEFRVSESPMRVEVFTLSEDAHDQERFRRKIERRVLGVSVPFPTPEDVIVWKLRWGRPKDLDDVKGIILVQRQEGSLDWGYIRDWCRRHGNELRLDSLLESLPEAGRD